MKKLLILLLLLPLLAFGKKDECRKIKKSTDRRKGIILYRSPDLAHIGAIRQLKTDEYFVLYFHLSDDNQHFDRSGALVEFEDGSIVKDEQTQVTCIQERSEIAGGTSAGTTTHSGKYLLHGFFHINEANKEKFLSQKIKRIQLDDAGQIIPVKEADKIRKYISCLDGYKI